jgi:hypothetical protein
LFSAGEEAIEKSLGEICCSVSLSLETFAKFVNELEIVEKSDFYTFREYPHKDDCDVRYSVTIEGVTIDVNKNLLPVRNARSLALFLKTAGGRTLGHVKINQEVTSLACSDSPHPTRRVQRSIYVQSPDDVNDTNHEREMAVVSACEQDTISVMPTVVEGDENVEEEEADLSSLSIKCDGSLKKKPRVSVKGSGTGCSKKGAPSPESSRIARKEAAKKNDRDEVELFGPMSLTTDVMSTPTGVPLQNYKSASNDMASSSSSGRRGRGLFSLSGDEDNDDDGVEDDEAEDDDDEEDDDEDEDEMEVEVNEAVHVIGAAISGQSLHPSRICRDVNEVVIYDIHQNITDPQVRVELYHAVVSKMTVNARIVSVVAGHHVQDRSVNIDWLAELKVIKNGICKTLNFAPPVSKAARALLVDAELENQILSTAQTPEEKQRNRRLNKQANRATYQVLRLVISTAVLLKKNPDYKPPVVESKTMQYLSDDEKGAHYFTQAMIQYPDEDLEVLQKELARVECDANNLAVSIPEAKKKQKSGYSGSWKGMDKATTSKSGSSASKKRKRGKEEEEEEGTVSASAKKSEEKAKELLKSAEATTNSAKKELDAARKQSEATKKEADRVRKAEEVLKDKIAAHEARVLADLERIKNQSVVAVPTVVADAESTPASSSVTTPASTGSAEFTSAAKSQTALEIDKAREEIVELERLLARKAELRKSVQNLNKGYSSSSYSDDLTYPLSLPSQASQFFQSPSLSSAAIASSGSDSRADMNEEEILSVLRMRAAPMAGGFDFSFSWFFEAFLCDVLGKSAPSLPAVLTVVNKQDWVACLEDARNELLDNSILLESDGGLELNPRLGTERNQHVLLAMFACTTLEHDLIKGILFKLLYKLFGETIIGCKIGYANKYQFVIKKRGERLDIRLDKNVSFSFFHTAEYNKYLAEIDKRTGKGLVDLSTTPAGGGTSGGVAIEVATDEASVVPEVVADEASVVTEVVADEASVVAGVVATEVLPDVA